MSKKFLIRNEAAVKLQKTAPANGTLFATKADCIGWGADSVRLAAYANTHYPVDDDIVLPIVLGQEFWIEIDSIGVPLTQENAPGGLISVEYIPV